jgi:hypothetical protein
VDQPRGHILLFTILINLQSLLKVYIDLEDIRLLYLMILCLFNIGGDVLSMTLKKANHEIP